MNAMWQGRLKGNVGRVYRYLTPLMAFVLIAMMYYLGVYSERTGFVDQVLDPSIKRITHPVLNAFRGTPPEVLQLNITIDEAELETLHSMRDQALLEGWLSNTDAPSITCRITIDERDLDALLNFKPGPVEPLRGRLWPFQVLLLEVDTLLGMQSFDLGPVRDASVIHAWLFNSSLKHHGLPSFEHLFSDLRINGRDNGLYALEGALDSMTLVQWGRGNGPVLRFDDGLLESTRKATSQRAFESDPGPQGDWMSAPVSPMRMYTMPESPDAALRSRNAIRALEDLRAGRRSASSVLDGPMMARLLAMADLFGAQYSTAWWNLRFLADSTNGRLLALPHRSLAGIPINTIQVLGTRQQLRFPARSGEFHERLFGDSLLYLDYIAYLDTFSAPGWLEAFMQTVEPDLAARISVVKGELPQVEYDRRIMEHCRTVIRQTLRPRDLVLAYHQTRTGARDRIAVANVHSLPVLVVGHVVGTDTVSLPRPITLWPRERDRPISYTYIQVDLPADEEGPLHLVVHVLGLNDSRHVTVRAWSTFSAN